MCFYKKSIHCIPLFSFSVTVLKDSPSDQQKQWRNNMLQSPRYNEFILPSWLLQGPCSLGFTDMQDQQPQQGDARVPALLGPWLDALSSLRWRLPSLQLPITYLSKAITSSSAIALGISHQVLLTCFVSPEADHTAPTLLWPAAHMSTCCNIIYVHSSFQKSHLSSLAHGWEWRDLAG